MCLKLVNDYCQRTHYINNFSEGILLHNSLKFNEIIVHKMSQMVRWLRWHGAWVRSARTRFNPGQHRLRSSQYHVQIYPDVHSTFFTMSPDTFVEVNSAGAQSQPTNVLILRICRLLHLHPQWAFMACNGTPLLLSSPYIPLDNNINEKSHGKYTPGCWTHYHNY